MQNLEKDIKNEVLEHPEDQLFDEKQSMKEMKTQMENLQSKLENM
jgi:hypothetical protein